MESKMVTTSCIIAATLPAAHLPCYNIYKNSTRNSIYTLPILSFNKSNAATLIKHGHGMDPLATNVKKYIGPK